MNAQELFQVDFRELTAGELTRTWHLDDSFFSALDEQEIEHGELTATLRVKKKAAGYLLNIHATGTVEIPCDRCLAPMTQPIDAEDEIEVRLGETLEDDGDRITLPEDRPVLNVAWNLYETIALAIPIAHVHPDGECAEDVSQYLVADDEPVQDCSEGEAPQQPTDSRWDALKGLTFDE